MAWTTPRTWVAGEIVTASLLNTHVRDNLLWLPRPLDISGAEVDVTNTAVETPLYTMTIPANSMGLKGCVRVTLAGDYLNNSGVVRSLTLSVKVGGTTIYSDVTSSIASVATRHDWTLELWFANINSASVNYLAGVFNFSINAGATTGIGDLSAITPGASGPNTIPLGSNYQTAINTAVDQTFQVTATHPVALATLSVRCEKAVVEILGQAA